MKTTLIIELEDAIEAMEFWFEKKLLQKVRVRVRQDEDSDYFVVDELDLGGDCDIQEN